MTSPFHHTWIYVNEANIQFSSVTQLCPTLATPWTAVHQASLSITSFWRLLKLISIKSVMPSNHLILCRPLLLLPSIFPSIRVFSNESVLRIRWIGASASPSVLPVNSQDWFPLGLTGLISLQSKGLSRVFSNNTVQKHRFFNPQLSFFFIFIFFKFYFIFKLYIIVLVLPNIKMNPPQVYMCSL